MIFCSDEDYPIQSIVHPRYMFDTQKRELETQPIFIIRRATKEEYEAQGPDYIAIDIYPYFYEVSTD